MYRNLVKRYFSSTASIKQLAPNFSAVSVLPDNSFKNVSLSDYAGKYLYFFWYPAAFTFVCPTEVLAFSDAVDEFRNELNCEILGASCDSKHVQKAWRNTAVESGGIGSINFPLLADPTLDIAKAYGVLPQSTSEEPIDLTDVNHDNALPFRASYIIDGNGIIRHISISDRPVGRSVLETKRLIEAFQHADNNPGQVCPINWSKEQPTMGDTTETANDYFKNIMSKK